MALLSSVKSMAALPMRRAALSGCCTPHRPAPAVPPIYVSHGAQSGRPGEKVRQRISVAGLSKRPTCTLCTPLLFSGKQQNGLASRGPDSIFSTQRGFAISPLNPHIHRGVLYPRVPQPYVLVVLLRTVPGVGSAGETRYVRRGFFRHSLARRGWALPATWQNIDLVHSRMQQLQQKGLQEPQREAFAARDKRGGPGPAADGTEATPSAAAPPTLTAGLPGASLPSDDEGPALSWLRWMRLRFMMETEKTDSSQLTEPLMPQEVLQRLSEEGLDLLPGQLRLLKRRLPPSPHTHQQLHASDWPEEILQGRPLAAITRVGEYDVLAVLPTKSRPIARPFTLEVVSKADMQRALETEEREGGDEDGRDASFTLPVLP